MGNMLEKLSLTKFRVGLEMTTRLNKAQREIEARYLNKIWKRLSHKEQTWFVRYMDQQRWKNNPDKYDRDQKFFQTYGENGVRCFLSLEQEGSEMSEKILDIGQQLPEVADTIFQKYAELVMSSDAVEALLKTLPEPNNERYIEHIRSSLIQRANDVLLTSHAVLQNIQFASQVSAAEGVEQRAFDPQADDHALENYKKLEKEEIKKLQDGLTQIKADIELFTHTFKILRENNTGVSLEDFQESHLSILAGPEVLKRHVEDAQRMRGIYAQNFAQNPEKQQRLLAEFDIALQSDKTRLYIFTYQGKLLSFIRFDEKGDHTLYAGSFNVDPQARGMKIGEAMMEAALDREAKDHILTGTANVDKPITSRYIEGGFTATRMYPTEAGDINFDVIRDDAHRHLFKSRRLSQEEIMRLAPLGQAHECTFEITLDPKTHPFAPLQEKKYLTRYFQDKVSGRWYLVYERPSSQSSAEAGSVRDSANTGAGSSTSLAA